MRYYVLGIVKQAGWDHALETLERTWLLIQQVDTKVIQWKVPNQFISNWNEIAGSNRIH